jgi:hypothetical protein
LHFYPRFCALSFSLKVLSATFAVLSTTFSLLSFTLEILSTLLRSILLSIDFIHHFRCSIRHTLSSIHLSSLET